MMSRDRREIWLNGLFLDYPYSGTWTYTRNLTRELISVDPASQYVLAVRHGPSTELGFPLTVRSPAWPFRRLDPESGWIARIDKLGWEQIAWPWTARRADLLHALYFAAPALAPAPLLVTIHDVIPLRPDYQHNRAASVYSQLMRLTARRARAIIAVSNHARSEIGEALDFPLDRIHVTYEAPDPSLCHVTDEDRLAELRERYALPDRFVLYLGGTERRKNIETLVRAWSLEPTHDLHLVIVGHFRGDRDGLFPDIPTLVRNLELERVVHIVPFVAQADLACIFSAALLFCYPSLHEGFGLPPLEAMACGCPVIASDATSLPEVLGDAAVFLPPTATEQWLSAIQALANDEDGRNTLSERGRQHAASFSWTRTARETLAVYDQVLEG